MAIEWQTPKTNWVETDRFNISDYMRIKSNMEYLHLKSQDILSPFVLEEMAGYQAYTAVWNVDDFNRFERNLESIQSVVPSLDFGDSQTFFNNGAFIKYDELNRIESAILECNKLIDRQFFCRRRLAVRLGNWQMANLALYTEKPDEPDWYRFNFRFGNVRGAIK